ncbi:hypothetical protein GCM10027190_29400 [Spirosoma areae]
MTTRLPLFDLVQKWLKLGLPDAFVVGKAQQLTCSGIVKDNVVVNHGSLSIVYYGLAGDNAVRVALDDALKKRQYVR